MARCLLTVALLLVAAAPAAAQPLSTDDPGPVARARFELGTALYEQGHYAEAGEQFLGAYEASSVPEMLYNAAMAFRRAERPRAALSALDRYLAEAALEGEDAVPLAELRGELAAEVDALPEPTEPPPPDPQVADPDPAPPDATAPGGGPELVGPAVLLGIGGAALAGALVTGLVVVDQDASLTARCDAGECTAADQAAVDEGRALALATDVLWIAGSAVAVAGLVWLVVELSGGDADEAARHGGRVRF